MERIAMVCMYGCHQINMVSYTYPYHDTVIPSDHERTPRSRFHVTGIVPA